MNLRTASFALLFSFLLTPAHAETPKPDTKTTEPAKTEKPKKRSFFDRSELSKDRSIKGKPDRTTPSSKPRKGINLGEELGKDRSLSKDGKK